MARWWEKTSTTTNPWRHTCGNRAKKKDRKTVTTDRGRAHIEEVGRRKQRRSSRCEGPEAVTGMAKQGGRTEGKDDRGNEIKSGESTGVNKNHDQVSRCGEQGKVVRRKEAQMTTGGNPLFGRIRTVEINKDTRSIVSARRQAIPWVPGDIQLGDGNPTVVTEGFEKPVLIR
ncbi:hypothetical protein BJV78DRAFT_1154469 [Lactifluus subvellereus]|nr:hypothetical protein BJV78DRAFT_1154469 [Lactifluus subvellereus]